MPLGGIISQVSILFIIFSITIQHDSIENKIVPKNIQVCVLFLVWFVVLFIITVSHDDILGFVDVTIKSADTDWSKAWSYYGPNKILLY